MNDVFVYLTDLPYGVGEMITPSGDGDYTVYINARSTDAGRIESYKHALKHIKRYDHQSGKDVQVIEKEVRT